MAAIHIRTPHPFRPQCNPLLTERATPSPSPWMPTRLEDSTGFPTFLPESWAFVILKHENPQIIFDAATSQENSLIGPLELGREKEEGNNRLQGWIQRSSKKASSTGFPAPTCASNEGSKRRPPRMNNRVPRLPSKLTHLDRLKPIIPRKKTEEYPPVTRMAIFRPIFPSVAH